MLFWVGIEIIIFFFVGEELEKALCEIELDSSLPIYSQSASSELPSNWFAFNDLVEKCAAEAPDASTRKSLSGRSPACYVYTSGTTGLYSCSA